MTSKNHNSNENLKFLQHMRNNLENHVVKVSKRKRQCHLLLSQSLCENNGGYTTNDYS
jgi:hypothetical protein